MLYERSNMQLLSQSGLYITFRQQKFVRDATFKFFLKCISCFSVLYEMSREQHLSQSTLYIDNYQQKTSKSGMPRQIVSSTNKICQQYIPKAVSLMHSKKGAMSSSILRAVCT